MKLLFLAPEARVLLAFQQAVVAVDCMSELLKQTIGSVERFKDRQKPEHTWQDGQVCCVRTRSSQVKCDLICVLRVLLAVHRLLQIYQLVVFVARPLADHLTGICGDQSAVLSDEHESFQQAYSQATSLCQPCTCDI